MLDEEVLSKLAKESPESLLAIQKAIAENDKAFEDLNAEHLKLKTEYEDAQKAINQLNANNAKLLNCIPDFSGRSNSRPPTAKMSVNDAQEKLRNLLIERT